MDTGAMQDRVFGEYSSDMVIPCIVDGNPPPQIKWYKLAGESQVPVSYGGRYTLAADNSLHIQGEYLKQTTPHVPYPLGVCIILLSLRSQHGGWNYIHL